MVGEQEMEEDDDDDVDFNPYLQCSPSIEIESSDSLNRVEECLQEDGESPLKCDAESDFTHGSLKRVGSEDVDEKVIVEAPLDGFLTTEYESMLGGSEHEFDGDDKFFELSSDDYEEEEIEEVDQEEEMADDDVEDGELEPCQYSLKSASNGKDNDLDCCLNSGDNEISIWEHQDSSDMKGGFMLPTRNLHGDEDSSEKSTTVSSSKIGKQAAGRRLCQKDEMMDAISKRTRANYSLADMSLDQLEMFLQESDEDENFQSVDDEEEYRKFLLALQENDCLASKQPERGCRKDDEDDEEDMDFEVEIEEALESDDTSESVRKRKLRRPETREKRRQRNQLQTKGSFISQSVAPLRHLLPYVGNVVDGGSNVEKRNSVTETANVVWPSSEKRRAPVNGFTAHQIGQLYCLIHEHVQLLVQVFSLCILDPARQKIAIDTHRMLMELSEKRELLLSWKKTAFPDFCFRPPYTHPSLIEDRGENLTSICTFMLDNSCSPSTCYGPSGRELSNGYSGYLLSEGSTVNLSSSSPADIHSFGQNSRVPPLAVTGRENAMCRPPLDFPPDGNTSLKGLEQANSASNYASSEHFSRRMTGTSHHWKEPARPLAGATAESLSPAVPQRTSTFLPTSVSTEGPLRCKSLPNLQKEGVRIEWAPATSGPVRSLLDVAPLALVREFLVDVSRVVQEYRQSYLETDAYLHKCIREPLFVVSGIDEQNHGIGQNRVEGKQPQFGVGDTLPASISRPQVKKTMAAVLVESAKKQSVALVPKDAAVAVQRFLPFFNKAFFPHKPPPAATASRLLFTDAEDELLAMGLMMYNTDWEAIQQRFLPSKSMHQIFVRQKNRSSARAPENSIKAVRRMKSSPLTSSEKASIQEGLGMFKYDWAKVWQYCVPHRDPAVLPRQWRIAVGTQKSYKTSETSKERRRLYEASRRQRIANKKASDKSAMVDEKYKPTSATAMSLEGENHTSGSTKDAEDVYIREAFLDDWRPRGTNPRVSCGPSEEKQRKALSLSSKKRKSNPEVDLCFPDLPTWMRSQTVKTVSQRRKQTVKLAPGLPSVKLPPRVHILSQSHVQPQPSFSIGTRQPLLTSPWAQGRGIEKWARQSVQSNHASIHETSLHVGASSLQRSRCPSNQYRWGQTMVPVKRDSPALRVSDDSPDLTTGGQIELLGKISRQCQLSPAVENNEKRLVGQSRCDTTLAIDMGECAVQSIELCSMQCDPPCCQDSCYKGQPITKPTGRNVDSVVLLPGQFGCDDQNQVGSAVKESVSSNIQFCRLRNPSLAFLSSAKQATASNSAECQLISRGMPVHENVVSEVQIGFAHAQDSKKHVEGVTENGSIKPSKIPAKLNRRRHDLNRRTRPNNQRLSRSSPATKGPLLHKPSIDKEGLEQDSPAGRSLCGDRDVQGNYSCRSREVERWVPTGDEADPLEQHIIVMEQEELSDSEDEAAGVQFEHEEIGDSDKDAEIEKHNETSLGYTIQRDYS